MLGLVRAVIPDEHKGGYLHRIHRYANYTPVLDLRALTPRAVTTSVQADRRCAIWESGHRHEVVTTGASDGRRMSPDLTLCRSSCLRTTLLTSFVGH